jgi:hypothetical protein
VGLAKFARRIVGLQDVFPSSGQTIPFPDTLDGTVSPVVLWPSSAASLDRIQRAQQTSNSSVSPTLNLGFLGQGFYEEWLAASAFHTDAGIQTLTMNILDPAGAAVQLGRFKILPARTLNLCHGIYAGDPTESMFVDRPGKVWVPPGYQVAFTGSTSGAAYTFTIQRLLVVHPLAEPPVWP